MIYLRINIPYSYSTFIETSKSSRILFITNMPLNISDNSIFKVKSIKKQ